MDQPFNFGDTDEKQIVYVRQIAVSDLPEEMRAHTGGLSHLYAVHDKDGQRLAIVRDRALAFALARQHDMSPVNVH